MRPIPSADGIATIHRDFRLLIAVVLSPSPPPPASNIWFPRCSSHAFFDKPQKKNTTHIYEESDSTEPTYRASEPIPNLLFPRTPTSTGTATLPARPCKFCTVPPPPPQTRRLPPPRQLQPQPSRPLPPQK